MAPRLIRVPTCAAVVLGAALAVPAVADAETFCVYEPAACDGTPKNTLQEALLDAALNGSGSRDNIMLGAGQHNVGQVINAAGNPVIITGEGPETVLRSNVTTAGLVVVDIREPATIVARLRIHHGSNASDATALKLAGTASQVHVTSDRTTAEVTGIDTVGSEATIEQSQIDLRWAPAVKHVGIQVDSGLARVRQTRVLSRVGIEVTRDGHADITHSRIRAGVGLHVGELDRVASATITDSLIHVPAPYPVEGLPTTAIFAAGGSETSIGVRRVTAYSNDGGTGIYASGSTTDTEVDAISTVLTGFSNAVRTHQDGGKTTVVRLDHAAYTHGTIDSTGGGTVQASTNDVDLAGAGPRFVDTNPATLDLRPRHDSPLVDAGDPADGGTSSDLAAGNRYRNGDGQGAPGVRVDVGAYEYQRSTPDADIAASTYRTTVGTPVTLEAVSLDTDPGEALTFAWEFSDGTTGSGPVQQHAFATPGVHYARYRVTDPTGLSSTAEVEIVVDPQPLDPQPGLPPSGSEPGDGSAMPAPGGGATAPPPARIAPRLAVRLQPRRFKAAAGTRIALDLSEPARVTFTAERKVVRRCRASNGKRRRCTRWVRAGSFTRAVKPGTSTLRWNGKLGRKRLMRGGYRLSAIARDGEGLTGRSKRVTFTVV